MQERKKRAMADISIDVLRERFDEIGECWITRPGCSDRIYVDGRRELVRRVMFCLHRRIRLRSIDGMDVWPTCGEIGCHNPAHLKHGDKKARESWRAEQGLSKRGPAARAKMAASARRRKAGTALTPEKVRLIRESPLSSYKLGPQLGCSPSTVRLVRRGESWRDYTPGSSIFTLGAR